MNRGSLASIVTRLWLDEWSLIPARNTRLISTMFTGPWACQTSCPVDTKTYFIGNRVAGAFLWPLNSTWSKNKKLWSYTSMYLQIYDLVLQ